jgi:hypothetical protein
MRFASLVTLAVALPLAAACGGNVVVDPLENGGSGGTSVITIPTGSTTTPTGTTVTTSTTSTTSTSTTSTTTPPPLPCGGTVVSQDPTCQSCLEDTCCAELAACAPGTSCDKLVGCAIECPPGDPACQQGCISQYEGGLGNLQALLACSQGSCGIDQFLCLTPVCGFEDAQAIGAFCGECVSQSCCAELSACLDDPACLDCLTSPDPSMCAGDAVYEATASCILDTCGLFCGG